MIESDRKYNLRELATDLGLTPHFTEKYIEKLGIKGVDGFARNNQPVIFYSYHDFLEIRNEIEKEEEEIEKLYSPKDIAQMAGVTKAYVCNLARQAGIKPVEKTILSFRKVYYDEKQLEIILDFISRRQNTKETDFDNNNNPLVTDKRFYNLSYFPDIVPECFKELED